MTVEVSGMLGDVAALQALVVGAILVWTGVWKLLAPRSREIAARSALAVLLPSESLVHAVYRGLGAAETALGLLLLLPPVGPWVMPLASGLAAGFVIYLLVSLKVAPARPCACLGWREAAASWRGVGRAALVLVFTVIGWNPSGFWPTVLAAQPWYAGLVAVEALVFLALSPEVNWAWVRRGGASASMAGAAAEEDCAFAAVPLSNSVRQLRGSALFRELSSVVKSDLVDHWRQGCWRFLCFAGEHQSRKVTVVFAVPVSGEPGRMRASIIDEGDRSVLLNLGGSPRPTRGDAAAAGVVGIR